MNARNVSGSTLVELYQAHQGRLSDKWSSYLDFYEERFQRVRGQPIRLLEVGVQNGGSLEIWAKYFPDAEAIVGCDIDPNCGLLTFKDPRIKVFVGDAAATSTAELIAQHSPYFDIVIDDGSHRSGDIVRNFANYFPRLADGGFYIMEDLHASYFDIYEGGLEAPYSSINFVKRLIDYVNSGHWRQFLEQDALLAYFANRYDVAFDRSSLGSIGELIVRDSIAAVTKQSTEKPRLGDRLNAGDIADVQPRSDLLAGLPQINPHDLSFGPLSERAEFTVERRAAKEAQIQNLTSGLRASEEHSRQLEDELDASKKQLKDTNKALKTEVSRVVSLSSECDRLKELLQIQSGIIQNKRMINVIPEWLRNRLEERVLRKHFDSKYYLDTNPDVASDGMDPYAHFSKWGWREGRNPSADFSISYYLADNPDIGELEENPFHFHYLKGRWEGREAIPVTQTAPFSRQSVRQSRIKRGDEYIPGEMIRKKTTYLGWLTKFNPFRQVRDAIPDRHFAGLEGFSATQVEYVPIRKHKIADREVKLAVVLHAFYLDTAIEILKLLKHVQIPFTLFLTTTAENAERLKAEARTGLPIATTKIVIGRNRGRNFGPMLVELRKALSEFDVLLHLHTKQSLRTGEEQSRWRNHILNHLVGSPELVQSILRLIKDDERVGVVGPINYADAVPYWCQYWLANTGLALEWLPKFGVRHFPKVSLLDFPVGGMFWARIEAIKGILDFPWRYEDFAAEPIPADGTVAHMLERAFGVVSVSSGYTYTETDLGRGAIRVGGSEKSLSQYARQADRLRQDAFQRSVISFDFYDTLFARLSSSPEDVQHYVGHYLHTQGLVQDPSIFFVRRKQAERELRERHDYQGDVNLDEIFANIQVTDDFSSAAIEAGRNAEMDAELRVLVPRTELVQLASELAASGRRVIIVSDSYMPKSFFESVLKKFNLEDVFSAIYVSSEERKRKDNGSLWNFIAATEVHDREEFLHIGDNFRSDMQIPGDMRLATFGIIGTSVLANMRGAAMPHLWDIGETDWRNGVLLGPQIALIGRSALSKLEGLPLYIESPREAGYCVLGPMLFGFISWLTQRARRDGVKRLCFLARDCEYLLDIYSSIREECPELKMPEPLYLRISRRAALPAAIAAGFPVSKLVRETGEFTGTFGEFLESRLGFDQEALDFRDRVTKIDPVAKTQVVLNLFEKNKTAIFSHCNSCLELLTRFLEKNGLIADESLSDVALVDLGYSGTIQSALQFVLNKPLKGYYFATSSRARELDTASGFAAGYFGDQKNGEDQTEIYRYSILVEAFLQGSSGSVVSYRWEDGDVHPNYGPVPASGPEERDMFREVIGGAKDYCLELVRSYGSSVLEIGFSPREAEKPFLALVKGKIRLSPKLEASLEVEDDFCGNGVISTVRHVRSMAGGH
jgi:FMN phosphatase YigB (HAD superfamily)